jgi:hypothetical protein
MPTPQSRAGQTRGREIPRPFPDRPPQPHLNASRKSKHSPDTLPQRLPSPVIDRPQVLLPPILKVTLKQPFVLNDHNISRLNNRIGKRERRPWLDSITKKWHVPFRMDRNLAKIRYQRFLARESGNLAGKLSRNIRSQGPRATCRAPDE